MTPRPRALTFSSPYKRCLNQRTRARAAVPLAACASLCTLDRTFSGALAAILPNNGISATFSWPLSCLAIWTVYLPRHCHTVLLSIVSYKIRWTGDAPVHGITRNTNYACRVHAKRLRPPCCALDVSSGERWYRTFVAAGCQPGIQTGMTLSQLQIVCGFLSPPAHLPRALDGGRTACHPY